MANEMILNTRIQLKYDSYANWTNIEVAGKGGNLVLKAGEVGICTIPSGANAAGIQNPPHVMFKVGDGATTFANLPWVSALAADVHSWAKKSEDEFKTWVNTIVEHPAAPVIGTGSDNGTISVDGEDVKVKGLESAAYTTVEALNATAKGYADAVEAKIPTEVGVMTVTAADDTVVVEGEKDVTIKVAPNKFDAYGAAEAVQGNLTAYEEAHKDDYTNSKIDELVQGAKDYADANDANTEYHVEYDSTNKKIKLVAGADASKMEIDATDFIKDGMIESVELVTEDDGGNKGQFLKITWNTDGDVDADDVTYVNVTTLVDVYVGENGDYVNVTVTSDNKIKADLTDATKTKLNKVWEEVGVAAGLDAALKTELQKEIDDDIVAYDASKKFGDIITHNAAEFASSTENGAKELAQGVKDVVDANKATWDKAGTALQASDLTAYDTSKNFGDIITHNVAEFATNAENGAKALADANKDAIDAINNAETGILAQAKAYTDGEINKLHKVATSGSAYDLDEVGTAMKGEETVPCFFFYCGTATDLV